MFTFLSKYGISLKYLLTFYQKKICFVSMTSYILNTCFNQGGKCHLLHSPEGSLKQLSTMQFFYNGHFYKNYPLTKMDDTVYKFGDSSNESMCCINL